MSPRMIPFGRHLADGLAAAGIVVSLFGNVGPAAAEGPAGTRGNRLASSANPYLLQHANNPVDWYPWGPEAFEKAKRENKPIFLSVGYSTCFWCHVAERTLYSDPAIAKRMNEWFVNVKVDREERPDVDSVYMRATQLMTGRGGWPNNVFLTPDLRPFYGGSYFPPEDDAFGRPGFRTIMEAIHERWTNSPQILIEQGGAVHAAMKRSDERSSTTVAGDPGSWLRRAARDLQSREDRQLGGFTAGDVKFPREPALGLLLADFRATGDRGSLAGLTRALDAMAFGGIHDHVGGGFHRYSTEATWSIPHFEKMLYNNAQLLGLYAETFAATRDPLYREVSIAIAGYLDRRMRSRDGGFFTAEDAEVEGEEGRSYLWGRAEIEAALGKAGAREFLAVYEIKALHRGSSVVLDEEQGRGVLRVRMPLPPDLARLSRSALTERLSRLEPMRGKLLAARDRRAQPLRDDKIVIALNGMVIEALAKAGRRLGKPEYLAWSEAAAEHLWMAAFDEKTGALKHQIFRGEARVDAYLDDYALLGLGYLALHEATGKSSWRDRAGALGESLVKRFGRPDGGLAMTMDQVLPVAPDEAGDSAVPDGVSAAFALLKRLSATQPRFGWAADRLLRRMSVQIDAAPDGWGYFVAAAHSALPATALVATPTSLDTADHVRAVAKVVTTSDRDELVVTLTIDAGYHVNANPATLENLIPTTLSVPGIAGLRVTYPAAARFKSAFSPETLDVYEGEVSIVASAAKGALAGARPRLRAQACDAEVCLPPADIPIRE